MTSAHSPEAKAQNRSAVLYMIAAVVGFSLTPLLIALAGAESPFLFNAGWRFGVILGCLLFLAISFHRLMFDLRVWTLVRRHAFSWAILLGTISYLERAFFVWSTRYVDVSITAVLFEIWPISVIFVTGRLFRQEGRYQKITTPMYLLLGLALIGYSCVIFGQAGGIDLSDSTSLFDLAFGVTLATIAAVLVSFTAFSFRWGTEIADDLDQYYNADKSSLELFGVVVGIAISSILAVPTTAGVGLLRGETVSTNTLVISIVGGTFIGALASIIWRKANLITLNLGVNAIAYLSPIIAVIWLFAFSFVSDVRIEFLIIGMLMIVSANVLINFFRVEIKPQHFSELPPIADVSRVIESGESASVEFKSSLRINLHTGNPDREMENSTLKTLAAFLNTEGGTLFIGVDDSGRAVRDRKGKPVGIKADRFKNEDATSLFLRNKVTQSMGSVAMAYIIPSFSDYDGARVMVLQCHSSDSPVYVKEGNRETFYIRTGPSTTELNISEAIEFIDARF